MQPFPPSGDPTPPSPGGTGATGAPGGPRAPFPPTTPTATPPPARGGKGAGPLLVVAAVATFALLVAAIVVIVTQAGRTPSADDLGTDTPAFQTKPPPSTDATSGVAPSSSRTTEAPSSTESPTSPPTTSAEQSLAEQLGEDVTADQLRVPAKPPARGQYKFLDEVDGSPVSFDACRTIHYVVHVGSGPANGLSLVNEAIRRISAVTGLRFQYDGPTNTIPQWTEPAKTRNVTDLASELTPVFIGWATKNETDIWAHSDKDVLGVGAPETIVFANGGAKLYATGHAVLLPSTEVADTFGPGVTEGNLVLHELGHVLGLDHVTEAGEIMEPDLTPKEPDGYGPGDLQGLYQLGASKGCASTWLAKQMGMSG